MIEETFDVEFDETSGSQGASDNLDDVGGKPLRDAMKIIEPPSTSHVPQDEDKEVRDAHEYT